jgi:tRNA (mo5U34)-methyltransferase
MSCSTSSKHDSQALPSPSLRALHSHSVPVDQLKGDIIRLGPWHHDVQVAEGLSTAAFLDAPTDTYSGDLSKVGFQRHSRAGWVRLMERIYPDGLEGRSLLECACNCGAYCFWAKEIGAGRCFGFDVREHWIKQARWLAEHRELPAEDVSFEQMDVYDLPKAGLEPFDIVMFKGIFYHLPDPVTALKGAADLCKELLILGTAVRTDLPDGMLAVEQEGVDPVMSGVYGLNWVPTGPKALIPILRWLGFEEVRVAAWFHTRKGRGRIRLLASRKAGRLDGISDIKEPRHSPARPA